MNSGKEPILQIRNLSKAFGGVQALDGVSFDVRAGEVHGLMGENGAGKSTLMNSLMGLIEPDEGVIIFRGEVMDTTDVRVSIDKGISMVHQEIMPIPELTVAQNIYLGKEMTMAVPGWLNDREITKKAKKQLDELGVPMDVTQKMKHLSIAQMQMVEIAKALSNKAKIIIMDEPTSSLSEKEVEQLFSVIQQQKERGVTVIYISHRLEEIFQTCDAVSVLRDGKHIDTKPVSEMDENSLINRMVGRKLETVFPPKNRDFGDVIFSVENLGKKGQFSDISFEIREGEVLGFAGLIGAGRTNVVRSIMGVESPGKGSIEIKGQPAEIRSPEDAIRLGISWVTEDRKGSGIIPDLSVKKNITLSSLEKVKTGLFINKPREEQAADAMIDNLRIKTPDMHQKVRYLSGGNQQKVVISKSLLSKPDVLILDEPTRGIDVGAKFEIYQLIDTLAREGKAILLISSELPELLGLSHRIMVLSKGTIRAELPAQEATQHTIMEYAMEQ